MARWKIGELARRTGLTLRTLRHYDEIGLLPPAARSDAGYRLYDRDDVTRLTQIVALRQIGLGLDEIRRALARPEATLEHALDLQISRLRVRIDSERKLLSRLEAIRGRLGRAEEVSAEELTQTLEMMTMYDKYLSKEQMSELEERKAQVGAERIAEVEAEWPRLIAAVRAEMDKGTDPRSDAVRRLARRWMELVQEFTGGNAELGRSVARMYREEPSVRQQTGLDSTIMEYVSAALAGDQKA